MGIAAGVIVVLFLALFVALSIADSPTYAWRVLRYGESDTQDFRILPERAMAPGASISQIPAAEQAIPSEVSYEYKGKIHRDTLEALLEKTDTRAFLIVQDDELILEKYRNSSRDSVNTSFSSAKSVNSALIGAAIADGYIGSVEALSSGIFPRLQATAWTRSPFVTCCL
jgi:hypothetical protein